MPDTSLNEIRDLLVELGNSIRDTLLSSRPAEPGAVARESLSDTIYTIDTISEEAILQWFDSHWPDHLPVELVMEGLEGSEYRFPKTCDSTEWKCIIDPIDGTRGLMYDKRSAWALAAVAPQHGSETRLSHIQVAVMTELPTSKQWRADQISCIRGNGIRSQSFNVFSKEWIPLDLHPSNATDFRHGFASLVKFFPEGRALTSQLEEKIWDELYKLGSSFAPVIFDDQYISTGGQFYEILAGHDRMIGDLRPLLYKAAGISSSLFCHPYDVCTALILQEAGAILENPDGSPVDAPLDTVTPVLWMAYANETLARQIRPVLQRLLQDIPALSPAHP